MPSADYLRVAALVDLPRRSNSGGHVKCWERLAEAAAETNLPLDLTVYFSNAAPDEAIGAHVRLRHLAPVFSSAKLKFLPYTPDTSDLASWHGKLARELKQYDVVHSTDGYFAFARTADKVCRQYGIPHVTSFHTDTPTYTRIFTRETIEKLAARWPQLQHKLIEEWKWPERQGRRMETRLANHVRQCDYALVTRAEDRVIAEAFLPADKISPLRLGLDKKMFGTHRADRAGIMRDYHIQPDKIVALFVGRVDVTKNVYTLIDAADRLLAKGAPIHLILAGEGPAKNEAKQRLGDNVSLPGYVGPDELGRLFASVDVVVLCSEIEIRSMVGGEALVSGCPVLVSEKSGVAPLFDNTPGMRVVQSGAHNWVTALDDFISDPARRDLMRMAALSYGMHMLPSWRDVVEQDLFPVWQRAAAEKKRNRAA